MNTIDVWDPDYNLDMGLANVNFGINWFESATIYSGVQHLATVKKSTNKTVVLVNWWLYQSSVTDLSWADLIVCYTTELIHKPWEEFDSYTKKYFNNENIIYIVGGNLVNEETNRSVLCPALSFFLRLSLANDHAEYDLVSHRPFIFDALLGGKSLPRILLFDRLKKINLLDKSLINIENNIFNSNDEIPDYRSAELDLLEEPLILEFKNKNNGNLEKLYSANVVEKYFKNHWSKISASHIIPYNVYKNSWYSIVAETQPEEFNFITEKTGKCFFSKRIFICFAAPGHLKLLHNNGFKTFDGIIDESYDSEFDTKKRLDLIERQIKFLAEADPVEIYRKAKSIVDYNFERISNMSWKSIEIKNFISSYTNKLK